MKILKIGDLGTMSKKLSLCNKKVATIEAATLTYSPPEYLLFLYSY